MVRVNEELLRDPRTGIVVSPKHVLDALLADDPIRARTVQEVEADVHRVARVLRYVIAGGVVDVPPIASSGAAPAPTPAAVVGSMSLPAALLQVLTEDGAWWTCAELVDYVRGQRLTSSQVNAGSVGVALGALLKQGRVERREHESRRGQFQWRACTAAPSSCERGGNGAGNGSEACNRTHPQPFDSAEQVDAQGGARGVGSTPTRPARPSRVAR